jgi:hypothetical protein
MELELCFGQMVQSLKDSLEETTHMDMEEKSFLMENIILDIFLMEKQTVKVCSKI